MEMLAHQPESRAELPITQKVVEDAGHLCVFLPKYHCQIDIIEYFWGASKRYTREHCDYTFERLKNTVKTALASVPLETIRRWRCACGDGWRRTRGVLEQRDAEAQANLQALVLI